MKKFRVGMYYTETGHVIIAAKDEHEAMSKVYKQLEDNGLDELEVDCNDREYDTTDCTEVEDGIK